MLVEDLWRLPMSQELAITLTRAIDTAKNQQHSEITLEHLLASLIDDHDANEMLVLSNVDIDGLIDDVLDYESRLPRAELPNNLDQPCVCNNLKRVLESAATAARQGGRKEINGAIVLAAIVGDGKSIASDLLRSKGLTFEEAIRAIQRALTSSPSASVSVPTLDERVENERARPSERPSDLQSYEELQAAQPSIVGGAQAFSSLPSRETVLSPRIFQETANAPQEAVSPIAKVMLESAPLKPAPSNVKPPKEKFSARPPHSSPSQNKNQQGSAALFSMPLGQHPNAPSLTSSNPGREQRQEFQRQGRASLPMGPTITPPSSQSNQPNRAEQKTQQKQRAQPQGREAAGSPSSRSKGFPSKGTVRVAASQLVVNLPRRMHVLRPILVEAKVLRSDIKAISEGLQDGGAVYRHEIAITKAISVRLRAPQGGFWIENASPETQWVENIFGVVSDDFIRWRWTVTPKTRGKKTLQVLMSARTIGTDGVAAETALPDQVMLVKVQPNFGKFFLRVFNWLVVFALFGLTMRHWDNVGEKINNLIKLIIINLP